jgi:hypothetical protein
MQKEKRGCRKRNMLVLFVLLNPLCRLLHREKKVSETGGMMSIVAVIAWGIGSSKDDNKKWSPLTMNATGFPKGTPFKSRPWKGSQNLKVNVINRHVTIRFFINTIFIVSSTCPAASPPLLRSWPMIWNQLVREWGIYIKSS